MLRRCEPLTFWIGHGGLEDAPWAFARLIENAATSAIPSRAGYRKIMNETWRPHTDKMIELPNVATAA